jgi:hypothetical protein
MYKFLVDFMFHFEKNDDNVKSYRKKLIFKIQFNVI